MILLIVFKLLFLQNLNAESLPVGKFEPQEWLMNVGSDTYEYSPDSVIIEDIKSAIGKNYVFLVFAASWCGDSKSEVPKIIRIMEQIKPKKIDYFNLDREKQEPSGAAEKIKIKRVPTLIIKYNNEEIGRIVEYPDSTIEYDINEILKLKCFK